MSLVELGRPLIPSSRGRQGRGRRRTPPRRPHSLSLINRRHFNRNHAHTSPLNREPDLQLRTRTAGRGRRRAHSGGPTHSASINLAWSARSASSIVCSTGPSSAPLAFCLIYRSDSPRWVQAVVPEPDGRCGVLWLSQSLWEPTDARAPRLHHPAGWPRSKSQGWS